MKCVLELTIKKDGKGLVNATYDRIDGDSLLAVLSQLPLLLARIAEQEKEYIERHSTSYICSKYGEDDIPF